METFIKRKTNGKEEEAISPRIYEVVYLLKTGILCGLLWCGMIFFTSQSVFNMQH